MLQSRARRRAKLAEPIAVADEEAQRARKIAAPLRIDGADQRVEREPTAARDGTQILPELFFEREARRMSGDGDRMLADEGGWRHGSLVAVRGLISRSPPLGRASPRLLERAITPALCQLSARASFDLPQLRPILLGRNCTPVIAASEVGAFGGEAVEEIERAGIFLGPYRSLALVEAADQRRF